MAKYKCLTDLYDKFTIGEIYDENENAGEDLNWRLKDCLAVWPEDWKLVEDDFILPENWYIKVISSGYFDKEGKYNRTKPVGTEITLKQFKKHVLGMNDKKIIGYKLKDDAYKYEEAAAKILNDNKLSLTWVNDRFIFGRYSAAEKEFRKAGVLDLWFEPVYEEEKQLPDIVGYKGKVIGDKLKYGCAEISISALEAIFNAYKIDFPNVGNRNIKSITLDSNIVINIEQIKQILDYIDCLY